MAFEDEFVRAEVDRHRKLVYITWLKHPKSEVFRPLFQKLVELTFEYQVEYWLSDACAIHYLEFSDQNWLLQDIAPYLKTTPIKKFARVTTKESYAMMDISRVYDSIKLLKDIQVSTQFDSFFSVEEALEWLFEDETHQ